MFQTLQYVNAALSRVQPELPSTASVVAHRMTFASFPIIGYSLTSDTVPQTQLWEMATYEIKPRLNRLDGVSTVLIQGGQEPEFHITPDPAKLLTANVTVTDILDTMRRTNLIDSPGLFERNHQLVLGLVSGQVRTPEQIANTVVKSTPAGIPVRIGDIAAVTRGGEARLHHRDRERETLGAAQHQPAAGQQHRGSRQRSSRRSGPHPEVAASGNSDSAVLRSVDHRWRLDQERARRYSAGPHSGFDHPGCFSAGLGNFDRRRAW